MTASATVHLPSIDRYRENPAAAPGVLDALQRLSFDSVDGLAEHVRTYDLGLVREVLLMVKNVGAEMDSVLRHGAPDRAGHRTLPAVGLRKNGAVRQSDAHAFARRLLEPWKLPPDPITGAQFKWHPQRLVELHEGQMTELRRDLGRILGIRLSGRDASDQARQVLMPKTPLALYTWPDRSARLYLGEPHDNWEVDSTADPTWMQPYDLARAEAVLAAADGGQGLARCGTCERFFVQVRRGDRYDKFCPGYDECSEVGRREYEKGNYRREYRRRQAALRRLRERPGVKAAELRRAEREFDAWRIEQQQLGNVRPTKETKQ